MPLYKLTERRLKRKERDDEAGLTELKAALREEMGDEGETDDDESDSDTDSDSSGEGDDGDEDEDDEEGMGGIAGPSGMSLPYIFDVMEQRSAKLSSGTSSIGDEDDAEGADLSDIDLQDLEDDEDVEDEDDDEEGSEGEEEAGLPPMSLSEALTSPIYPNRQTPTSRRKGPSSLCVLCPGKVLQSEKVVGEHLASLVCPP